MNNLDRCLEILCNGHPKKILFKNFLSEANYGSLQTDNRLNVISDYIIRNIQTTLKREHTLSGIIEFDIETKYTDIHKETVRLKWIFNVNVVKYNLDFAPTANIGIQPDPISKFRYCELTFNINRYEKLSDESFFKKLYEYTTSEIYIHITHEVKHLLDYIDKIFTSSKYVDDIKSTKGMRKYITQNREFDNLLITIIEELKIIKQKYPNITFNKAIAKSENYELLNYYISVDESYDKIKKLNKLKSKIAYFWYITYENRDFNI